MKLNATIHAEHGVSDQEIKAVETGLMLTFSKTGLQMGINAVKLSQANRFPTLPNGQVSDEVMAGHSLWMGGGPNVWLTSRDMTHYDRSVNFLYGVASQDGHMAVSSARLDINARDNPLQLMTVTAHEAGHMVGLVDPSEDRHDSRYGFHGHCSNECTMKASNGMADTERAVKHVVDNISTAGFCISCLGDLQKFGRDLSAQ